MKNLICSIAVLWTVFSFVAAKDGKWIALALQGGGDKGAYQAGALYQIIMNSDPEEVQYDVISGVSIGSINGAFLAGFEKGKEKEAAQYMVDTWGTLHQEEIYKEWPWGGAARGLLFESALFDSSPFRKYIRKVISPPKRHLLVSATDASTGIPKTWDDSYDWETLIRAIDASSSFPGFFQPVQDLDNTTYYDGGTSFPLNIYGAVNKWKELGYNYTQMVIDVVMCTGATFQVKDVSKYSTIPLTLRFLEIERYYDAMELLERAIADFPGAKFRYTIAPSGKIETSPIPMTFSHKQILEMIEIGKKDAEQAMKMGHGVSTNYLLEYTSLKLHTSYDLDYGEFLKEKDSK